MIRQRAGAIGAACVSLLILSSVAVSTQGPAPQGRGRVEVPAAVRDHAAREGRTRVLIELRTPGGGSVPEARLPGTAAIASQRRAIADTRGRVTAALRGADHKVTRMYETLPYVALEVTPAALAVLETATSDVARILEDKVLHAVLANSVPFIQADQAWASGYEGSGTVVAILDTGVDASHPFLSGKVVEEACYSSTVPGMSLSFCPNGLDEQLGPGAAAPCSVPTCEHGTHVAGIAAGNGDFAGQTFSGVAKDAHIMAVQVFSEIVNSGTCGTTGSCVGAYSSDIIAGLERVYTTAAQRNIVAVNLSLGGGSFSAPCDDEPYKPAIDNLRAIGIATVVASGNSYATSMISSPACISSAISVGSVDTSDNVSWFSNIAPFLSLLAPGDSVTSSVPGGGYGTLAGTSMAAPHVTGTWALVRQAAPSATVAAVLTALRSTGRPVTDTRTRFSGEFVTTPRVQVFQALGQFVTLVNPAPSAAAVSPARVRAGLPVTITVTGASFNAQSIVRWNGMPKPTTAVSTTRLLADLSANDVAQLGTNQVSVFAPAPGGGTSSALTVFVDPPPVLTLSTSTATAGTPVSVTLTNGFGGSTDWIGVAPATAPDTTYLQYTYIGTGLTTKTWTVNAPGPPGTYEFRLFLNNGYTRVATSAPLTVLPNPVPAISSISPARAVVGDAALTMTVLGTGFVPSSVVRWNGAPRATTFVSTTQVRAAIQALDLSGAGTAQVSVFSPEPGGGVSSGLPFTVGVPPTLAVSRTSAESGDAVTVTLANGIGGPTDWLALASTSAANTSYVQYTYVGAGVTARTWTVTMPAAGGTYEFRLFANDGYIRVGTSPAVVVTPKPNPMPAVASLSPSSAVVDSASFSLTVNGSGFSSTSAVRWNGSPRTTTFINPTLLRASISRADLASVGTAQVTVASPAPGGGTSNALPFSVRPAPALTVSAASAAPGASVTVTLTNGPGGAQDWIGLAFSTAVDTSYITYTYVGAGLTTRTWTVAMPTTPGTYEFRLFLNNGYARAATSPTVTVATSSAPGP